MNSKNPSYVFFSARETISSSNSSDHGLNEPKLPYDSNPGNTKWKSVGNATSKNIDQINQDSSSDAFIRARKGRARAASSPSPFGLVGGPPGLGSIQPIYEEAGEAQWKPWQNKSIWDNQAPALSSSPLQGEFNHSELGAPVIRESSAMGIVEEGMERAADAFTQNIVDVDYEFIRNRTRSKSSSATFDMMYTPSDPAYTGPSIWSAAANAKTAVSVPTHRRSNTGPDLQWDTTPEYFHSSGYSTFCKETASSRRKSDFHSNLETSMESMRLTNPTDIQGEINDYFENTEYRAIAYKEAGKNLQMQGLSHTWPVYVIEFKAGRKDFVYIPENVDIKIKKGDLVMVEADRGQDLGKVIIDNLKTKEEINAYQVSFPDALLDSHSPTIKEVAPKRVFRVAQPIEISMLLSKNQDEAKAMAICQAKIRQRKLPMEVVDAEYQWDRKKLTFYFVSDRRIDFRDLVRELFKLYKTRIWMCAVQSFSN